MVAFCTVHSATHGTAGTGTLRVCVPFRRHMRPRSSAHHSSPPVSLLIILYKPPPVVSPRLRLDSIPPETKQTLASASSAAVPGIPVARYGAAGGRGGTDRQAAAPAPTDGLYYRGAAADPAPAGQGGRRGGGGREELLVVVVAAAMRRRRFLFGRVVGRGHGGGRTPGVAGGAHDRGRAAAAHDAAHLHRHGRPPRRGAARRRRHRQLAHQRLGIQRPGKPD